MNFGYSIQKDNQIDYDKSNHQIADFVRVNENSFNICMACGSCSATCSANKFTNFNPRKLFLMIARGDVKFIDMEIDKCMLCGKCQLVCPRGISTRNIIIQIKKALNSSKIL